MNVEIGTVFIILELFFAIAAFLSVMNLLLRGVLFGITRNRKFIEGYRLYRLVFTYSNKPVFEYLKFDLGLTLVFLVILNLIRTILMSSLGVNIYVTFLAEMGWITPFLEVIPVLTLATIAVLYAFFVMLVPVISHSKE